jgi:hypothetical protein
VRRGGSFTPVFDYMLALLGIFLIIAITEKPKTTPARIDTLGLYAVEASWPLGSDDDVDLWVQDPHGDKAWYGGLTSAAMTLNGDDLGCDTGTGFGQDKKKCHNGERTIIKSAERGEYVVNVHMYVKNNARPTPVTCTLWELRGDDRMLKEKHVILVRQGQEVTCFRFTINAAGNVSGYSDLPKSLIGGPSTGGTSPRPFS